MLHQNKTLCHASKSAQMFSAKKCLALITTNFQVAQTSILHHYLRSAFERACSKHIIVDLQSQKSSPSENRAVFCKGFFENSMEIDR